MAIDVICCDEDDCSLRLLMFDAFRTSMCWTVGLFVLPSRAAMFSVDCNILKRSCKIIVSSEQGNSMDEPMLELNS